ncbi:hypothetical protein HPB48_019669 [Haemaphysalis longicornis]|uniref:WIF domain-containing protein n=1 Tax=Haemaphysalis longicornis TaxID=44386 RepID=A0A9J6G508_HAELO|nr:hypothetical protein HPB48_019669 [Haemaphysalis longicornis]
MHIKHVLNHLRCIGYCASKTWPPFSVACPDHIATRRTSKPCFCNGSLPAGLDVELYYVKEGRRNEYALGFVVPVPANVSELEFVWQALGPLPLAYTIDVQVRKAADTFEKSGFR